MREEDIRRIIMWLPRDERRLLEGYYVNICEVEKEAWFKMSHWLPVLKSLCVKRAAGQVIQDGEEYPASSPRKDGFDMDEMKKNITTYAGLRNRLEVANRALEKRGLVKRQKHKHRDDVDGITLTIDGYDLGRRYSEWFTRTGSWFAEYRNHWIWLIVSFFGGVLGAVLANWLSKI
jgi:hypothetical protein